MSGLTIVLGAFALALVVASLTFMGGAVVVALPLAIIAIALAAVLDFNRRRKAARSIHTELERSEHDVEFTDRDRRTLTSE
jgi:anti-sigma factor RsiW